MMMMMMMMIMMMRRRRRKYVRLKFIMKANALNINPGV
jgi:hypothetical protein